MSGNIHALPSLDPGRSRRRPCGHRRDSRRVTRARPDHPSNSAAAGFGRCPAATKGNGAPRAPAYGCARGAYDGRSRRDCGDRTRRQRSRPRARADRTHGAAGHPRHPADPGRRRPGSRRGLQELDGRQHHQGYPRLRARCLRAAQMGRRYQAVDPRLRPVAQFPSARRPALHGRHSHQHGGRLWRFPGNRPDRVQICRGLQGSECAAIRRQFAGRRHQLRDGDGTRSVPERRLGRSRRLRLPPSASQCRRRQRAVGWFRHRIHASGRGIPRSQQRAGNARQRQCRLSVLARVRDAVLSQCQRGSPAHPR